MTLETPLTVVSLWSEGRSAPFSPSTFWDGSWSDLQFLVLSWNFCTHNLSLSGLNLRNKIMNSRHPRTRPVSKQTCHWLIYQCLVTKTKSLLCSNESWKSDVFFYLLLSILLFSIFVKQCSWYFYLVHFTVFYHPLFHLSDMSTHYSDPKTPTSLFLFVSTLYVLTLERSVYLGVHDSGTP